MFMMHEHDAQGHQVQVQPPTLDGKHKQITTGVQAVVREMNQTARMSIAASALGE
jgi:hypothetical protein